MNATTNITNKKSFQKSVEFDLLGEVSILKKIKRVTFERKTKKEVKTSLDRMLNAKRPKRDIQLYKDILYTLYLCQYMRGNDLNFDMVYRYVSKDKNPYVDINVLKRLSVYNRHS